MWNKQIFTSIAHSPCSSFHFCVNYCLVVEIKRNEKSFWLHILNLCGCHWQFCQRLSLEKSLLPAQRNLSHTEARKGNQFDKKKKRWFFHSLLLFFFNFDSDSRCVRSDMFLLVMRVARVHLTDECFFFFWWCVIRLNVRVSFQFDLISYIRWTLAFKFMNEFANGKEKSNYGWTKKSRWTWLKRMKKKNLPKKKSAKYANNNAIDLRFISLNSLWFYSISSQKQFWFYAELFSTCENFNRISIQ